jgi:hypothetical protein
MKNCIIKQDGTGVSTWAVGIISQQKTLRLHPDVINLYQPVSFAFTTNINTIRVVLLALSGLDYHNRVCLI